MTLRRKSKSPQTIRRNGRRPSTTGLVRATTSPTVSLVRQERFDSARLSASQQKSAEETSAAIRRLLVSTANNIVQIGMRLNFIRSIFDGDLFQAWLREEFQWSQSVASNYMRAATAFDNVDCIEHFQPGALYALARHRASEEARTEAVRRAKAGEFISASLAELIIREHGGATRTRRRKAASAIVAKIKKLETHVKALSPEDFETCTQELQALVSRLQHWNEKSGVV